MVSAYSFAVELSRYFFKAALFGVILSFAPGMQAKAALIQDRDLVHPTFKNTISMALLPTEYHGYTNLRVNTTFPGQVNPGLAGRGRLTLPFLPTRVGSNRAPLVILMPGIGGTADSSATLYLANRIRNLGNHVLTIPNPVSAPYALAVSATGHPGHVSRDLLELDQIVIPQALAAARARGFDFTSISFTGYSLGAVYAAHLGANKTHSAGLPIKQILLLNPPIDVSYGLDTIDALYRNGMANLAESRRSRILFGLYGYVTNPIIDHPYAFNQRLQEISYNEFELAWVVGRQFRTDLTSLVNASQSVQTQVLIGNTPGARPADSFSFHDYVEQLLMRTVPLSANIRGAHDLIQQGSLQNLANSFRRDSRFTIIHSVDDFLLRNGDREWMAANFPQRNFHLNGGGHLGYFWTHSFQNLLAQILR